MNTDIGPALLSRARTVTGNNLKGTVKVLSARELANAVTQAAQAASEAARAAAAEAKAQADASRLSLEQELRGRLAELESQAKTMGEERDAAIAQARAQMEGRIRELEATLANDDARSRVVILEKEVDRLRSMVDRYESGLEFVTALERRDIAVDLSRADALKGKAGPRLATRLERIKLLLTASDGAVAAGIQAINVEGKGSLYGCTDLLESAIAIHHYHDELISIEQALGGA